MRLFEGIVDASAKNTDNDPLLIFRRPNTQVDRLIVFVHGFHGHGFNTWGRFPQLTYDLAIADVAIYGYTSGINRFWRPSIHIEEQSKELSHQLRESGYRQIIFVGHSMGGLISLDVLRRSSETTLETAARSLHQIAAVLLLGTPQAGSKRVPWWAKYISQDLRFLEAHSTAVSNIHNFLTNRVSTSFHNASPGKPYIPIFAVHGLPDQWVDRMSSTLGVPDDQTLSTRFKHTELPRPKDEQAQVFVFASKVLQQEFARHSQGQLGRDTAQMTSRLHLTREFWEDPPDSSPVLGRDEEIERLTSDISDRRCRIIEILGPGGIGKTAVLRKLSKVACEVAGFEAVYVTSLKNAPDLLTIMKRWVRHFSNDPMSEDIKSHDLLMDRLIEILGSRRLLLALDNAEGILQPQDRDKYVHGRDDYSRLIRRLAFETHASCVVLTTREPLPETDRDQNIGGAVRRFPLQGLQEEAAKKVLRNCAPHLKASDQELSRIVRAYGGNPLALRLVAGYIETQFLQLGAAGFIESNEFAFGEVGRLIQAHFNRLPREAKRILRWIAVSRESMDRSSFVREFESSSGHVGRDEFATAFRDLKIRGLVEVSSSDSLRYAIQPVIVEFLTDEVIESIASEIEAGRPAVMAELPLISTLCDEYVRQTQINLIGMEILSRFSKRNHQAGALRQKADQILENLRNANAPIRNFAAGNIINLLSLSFSKRLSNWDFSGLSIRQANLRDCVMHDVNLAVSELRDCTFADTFGSVLMTRFSPDGRFVGAANMSGEVRIWDAATGKALPPLGRHNGWIFAFDFAHDPKEEMIATAGGDSRVSVWNTKSGLRTHDFHGHTSRVRGVCFHPTDPWITTVSEDLSVVRWNLSDPSSTPQVLYGHDHPVIALDMSRRGDFLASGSTDGVLKVWSAHTKRVQLRRAHLREVRAIAFNHDGSLLATSGDDGYICIWDALRLEESEHPRLKWKAHPSTIHALSFEPHGNLLLSGGEDKLIHLWDIEARLAVRTFSGHENSVRSVGFSPDGSSIVSGGDDQTVRVWNVAKESPLWRSRGYQSGIRAAAFGSKTPILATGHDDAIIRIWDAGAMTEMRSLVGHRSRIWSLAFDQSGRRLVSGAEDGTIIVWDLTDERNPLKKDLTGHYYRVFSVCVHPNRALIASGGADKTVRIWDPELSQELAIFEHHKRRVRCVAFSQSRDLLITGGEDHFVMIWSVPKVLEKDTAWPIYHEPIDIGATVTCFAVNPAKPHLAIGSSDGIVRIWNLDTKAWEGTSFSFKAHSKQILSIAYSSDGEKLFTGSEDASTALWWAKSHEEIQRWNEHSDWVETVAISPDGLQAASGSDDQKLIFYETQFPWKTSERRGKRPYEGTNVHGVTGISEEEKHILERLGATDMPITRAPQGDVSQLSKESFSDESRKT